MRATSHWASVGALVLLVALLNACSSTGKKGDSGDSSSSTGGRYKGKDKDWGPDKEIDMSKVPDAVPRYETRTIAGNKNPYTVLGKTYYLMEDERAYKERGTASWYGYKFNGEWHTYVPPGYPFVLSIAAKIFGPGFLVYRVMMSLIGAFYYLRVVKLMYFDEPNDEAPIVAAPDMRLILSLNSLAIAVLGLMPGQLMSLCAYVLTGGQ